MPAPHTVFVYGTLKPGGHYWPQFCEGKVSEIAPAKVQGELYDLHVGYPGMRLKGNTWVHGFVLTFPSEADFLQLDYLEGYTPGGPEAQNEYNRLRVPYFTPGGESLGEVWAYEMTATTFQKHTAARIEDGNWKV